MSKSDQLGPQLTKYKADQEAARLAEENWISNTAADAESMDKERKGELQKGTEQAKNAAMDVMQQVKGALEAAETMDENVHVALSKIASNNVKDIDQLSTEMTGEQTDM